MTTATTKPRRLPYRALVRALHGAPLTVTLKVAGSPPVYAVLSGLEQLSMNEDQLVQLLHERIFVALVTATFSHGAPP